MYQWAADDFTLPAGMFFQSFSAPVNGETFSMYHGTSRANAAAILASGFRRSLDGMLGPGVYLTRDLKKARFYPVGHPEHDKVIITVLVNVGRVITIDCKGHPRQKNWRDPRCGEVYDTAWIPPWSGMMKSNFETHCVWDPNRIKILNIIESLPVQPGYGYGYGHGYGYGYGHGYGYGQGYGYGHGHGHGYGHGYGHGHGHGYGYGYGYGAQGYM